MESGQDKTGSGRAESSTTVSSTRSFLRRPKAEAFVAPAHGFIPVFVILVLFVLAAVFVKSLFFGILAAVLSIHFEQLLERRFFGTKFMRGVHAFLVKLNAPFTAFRRRITRRLGDKTKSQEAENDPGEQAAADGIPAAERTRIATRASAMTVIFVVVVTVLLGWMLVHFIRPFASMSGESMSQWAQNNHVVEKLEQKIGELLDRLDPPSDENAGKNVRERLRNRFSDAMEEHNADLAKYMFMAGNGLIKNAFHVTAWVGTFAFDLVMFLFFYYYFLLKMAVFAAGRGDPGQNLGEWTVSSIYESGWLPDASEHERQGAARIIDHIYGMFRAWLVGYFWIIVLETVLYALIFIPFNVPFWPVLSLIAGSTILLPFLGPVLAALLSVVVTIIFAQEGIVMPIIGITLAYLLIHVILEQLLLYPVLVGEAIGLTLVETIIVVLLGAVIAGISGMILAVPAAALLKLLVPLFYETLNRRRRRKPVPVQHDSADSGT
ncbi:MAG: AI-2E family transporter [Lentisphaeria bacterium]|nr:AI-2E family transporter [Lentisphaeria bacterium]